MDPTCHKCNSRNFCIRGKPNKNIENCPMIVSSEIEKEASNRYKTNENIKKNTKMASIIEASGYIHWPRLKDTIEFAKRMEYNKIGLASLRSKTGTAPIAACICRGTLSFTLSSRL